MCGIAGFLGGRYADAESAQAVLGRMARSMRARGPDDDGVWFDPAAGAGLAHRRLAIIDLTAAGHQPMASPSGRFTFVFNGEIYNHQQLRGELERAGRAPAWRGHSDTETLLAGFEAWGVETTIARTVGMFAFAAWDALEREMILGRDRLGEKPLYYGWQPGRGTPVFLFASDIVAIRSHPAFAAEVDPTAVALLMRHSYVPAPYSIYSGIAKLAPGSLLRVRAHETAPRTTRYWSFAEVARRGKSNVYLGGEDDAVDQLERLLREAIGRQMIADVPLGAFLSGGVDSSAVVALMQSQSARPVKTFTIGFNDPRYNEGIYAKAVAQHLGTDHTELYLEPHQALDVIPQLGSIYSEPFADSSQIPTYLISRLARGSVTVSLSGDGGDEIFGGYNRYLHTHRWWNLISRVPRVVRGGASRVVACIPPTTLDRLGNLLPGPVDQRRNWGEKLHKAADVMSAPSWEQMYLGLVSHWAGPRPIVLGASAPLLFDLPGENLSELSPVEQMMAFDSLTYLPDDILAKVDRAAMATSLETRVPYLDHRVVEFASTLPLEMKLRGAETKRVLRRLLYRHVPRQLIDRPKMGFAVPLDEWLRGPLKEWAAALLDPVRIGQEGILDAQQVHAKWSEHLAGSKNWQHHLWNVLMFQAWHEQQGA